MPIARLPCQATPATIPWRRSVKTNSLRPSHEPSRTTDQCRPASEVRITSSSPSNQPCDLSAKVTEKRSSPVPQSTECQWAPPSKVASRVPASPIAHPSPTLVKHRQSLPVPDCWGTHPMLRARPVVLAAGAHPAASTASAAKATTPRVPQRLTGQFGPAWCNPVLRPSGWVEQSSWYTSPPVRRRSSTGDGCGGPGGGRPVWSAWWRLRG